MSRAVSLIVGGKLPSNYAAAKRALAECSDVDEVKEVADKAAAMASYARQAKDMDLLHYAQRIRTRAIQRYGELLKEIEPQRGANQNIEGGSSPKVLTRKAAADAAGLSDDQRKTAIRIASVPKDEFERLVESDDPPTVTALAEIGTKRQNRPKKAPEATSWTRLTEAWNEATDEDKARLIIMLGELMLTEPCAYCGKRP